MKQSNRKPTLILIVTVGLLLICVYWAIDPENSYFVPKCAFKMMTGYDCPSCGSQRAIHALLNGDVVKAVKFNPFIFLIAPYLLILFYVMLSTNIFAQRIRYYAYNRITIIVYLLLYFLWWILRNTPLWHNVLNSI